MAEAVWDGVVDRHRLIKAPQLDLMERFGHCADKINLAALVTFVNKIPHALPRVLREIPNHRQLHPVVGKFL